MKYTLYAVGGLVGLFVLLAMFQPDTPESKDRRSRELAIQECWKEQGRKSLAPPEARFIAGACEKMEGDYRARFGRNP